ncbi:DNA-binding transcriptional LysR family regulator [Streptomyces sp. TLI_146]|nr:DNA-binding transcriptional LysR family regulator [Streptomyces sp. TLI_146]
MSSLHNIRAMDLELRHLRVVCAIAEAGSLTKAAAALRMTQPGLSAQLRRIETMLGGALFDRRRDGAVPTGFGELVLTRAQSILPGVDGLLADTTRAARRMSAPDRVRLGSVGGPLLGHLILAVRKSLPGTEVTARSHSSPVPLLEDVAAGRLEAAVLGDNPHDELLPRDGVVLVPFATEPVFALLPAAHPLAAQREVDLARLLDEDWAVPGPDRDRTREYWSSVCALTHRRPFAPYEAEGRQLIEIVRAGLAVSLCQATFIEVPGVAVRPLAGNPLHYRHVLAWRRDGPLAPHHTEILRTVRTGYANARADSPAYARWLEHRPGEEPVEP